MKLLRRQFLAMTSALVAGGVLAGKPGAGGAQTLRVRRDINTMTSTDPVIETLADAITKMHALPDSDERSWHGQAMIHLDHCHRQRWHFLTWHRLYLSTFEDIVRELTGQTDWAMPYWNWTANRQIPGVFFGSGNALDTETWKDPDPRDGNYHPRVMGPADLISSTTVSMQGVENQTNYRLFSDALEGRPHGGVHIAIGGHMGDFVSPLDPIFMAHHCNVDRVWAKWNKNHPNPGPTNWLNEPFDNMFADKDGNLITGKTAGDLLTTAGLGYRYDDEAPQPGPPVDTDGTDLIAMFRTTDFAAENVSALSLNTPATLSVKAGDPVILAPDFFDKQAVLAGKAPKQVVARLSKIEIPAEAENYVIRVFLNCPYLTAVTPPDDPHFVNDVSIFGLRQMQGMDGMDRDVLVDLTRTLVDLNLRQTPAREELNVQLVAVPLDSRTPTGTNFKIGRVEVIGI